MLVFLVSLVLVGSTAGLAATRLFPGEVIAPLMAAYVFALAEIIGLSFLLSFAGWLTRTDMVVGLVCGAVPAGLLALRRRRQGFPWRRALDQIRDCLGEPVLAILAALVLLALLYALLLGIATPPNDWDSMIYHLPRAVLWAQQGSIGYIHHATDLRLNGMPPNAEIVSLFTMLTSGGDHFVAVGQFTALVAAGLAVCGIALRVGLERRAAVFGALLFVSLPVVLLQAGTALNDVVVAALLLTVTYFALGSRSRDAALATLAFSLAVGTKFTAVLALPVLVVAVAALQPVRRWGRLVLIAAGGLAGGSYWYVLNLVETHKLDAGVGSTFRQIPDRSFGATLLRTWQLTTGLLELPATRDRGRWVYPAIGLLLVAAAILAVRHRRRLALLLLPAGVAVAATPVVFHAVAAASPHVIRPVLRLAGSSDLVGQAVAPTVYADAEPFAATYGAVGVIMLVAALAFAWRSERGRRLPLALAPVLFIPIFAFAVIYDYIRMRFLAYPIGLSAAIWGLVLPRRWLSTLLVALAGVTCVTTLAFASWKPSGIELLARKHGAWSVWTASRRRIVEATTSKLNSRDVTRFVAANVPHDASVGLAVRQNTALYQYLTYPARPTTLIPPDVALPRVDWLVVDVGRRADVDPRARTGWRRVYLARDGWEVLRARHD